MEAPSTDIHTLHCEKHPEPYTCCGVAQSYELQLDAERQRGDAAERELEAARDEARRNLHSYGLEQAANEVERRRADAAERAAEKYKTETATAWRVEQATAAERDRLERELEYAHIHGRNVEIERDEARRRVKELEAAAARPATTNVADPSSKLVAASPATATWDDSDSDENYAAEGRLRAPYRSDKRTPVKRKSDSLDNHKEKP